MAGFDWDNRDDELEELASRVSELASRVEEIWRALADRRVGELPPMGIFKQGGIDKLLGLNLNTWARRAGYHLARGSGLEPLERVLRSTIEREAGKQWEKLLVRSLGASVFTSFAGGAGVALIDSLFSAVSRALKPRRLNLPELAPLPQGSFPAVASYQRVLSPGTERTAARTVRERQPRSADLIPAAKAIESALAESLKRELP
ncbi:MAG: hypothetical protein B1H03_04180 [Planctomycetales bacterium 4484_113]|nr:MAG: hypothetical protein B1H03_04180 [Planctomycetales bacterium 4484_113]